MKDGSVKSFDIDEICNNHILGNIDTTLRNDAFKIDDEIEIKLIEQKIKNIMEILLLDFLNGSVKDNGNNVFLTGLECYFQNPYFLIWRYAI